jgi:hypothetical protein
LLAASDQTYGLTGLRNLVQDKKLDWNDDLDSGGPLVLLLEVLTKLLLRACVCVCVVPTHRADGAALTEPERKSLLRMWNKRVRASEICWSSSAVAMQVEQENIRRAVVQLSAANGLDHQVQWDVLQAPLLRGGKITHMRDFDIKLDTRQVLASARGISCNVGLETKELQRRVSNAGDDRLFLVARIPSLFDVLLDEDKNNADLVTLNE